MYAYLEPDGTLKSATIHNVRCIAWSGRCVFLGELRGKPYECARGAYHIGVIYLVYPDAPFYASAAPPHWELCAVDSTSHSRMTSRLVTLMGAALRTREVYLDRELHALVHYCMVIGQPVTGGMRVTRSVNARGRYRSADGRHYEVANVVPDPFVTDMAYELAAAHGVLAGPGPRCQDEWIEPRLPLDRVPEKGPVPPSMTFLDMDDVPPFKTRLVTGRNYGRAVCKHTHPVVLVLSGDPERPNVYLFRAKLDCTDSGKEVHCIILDIHPCSVCAAHVCDMENSVGLVPPGSLATYVDLQPSPLPYGGHRLHVPLDHLRANDATAGIVATYVRGLLSHCAIKPEPRG
jgi:hypothetical protein